MAWTEGRGGLVRGTYCGRWWISWALISTGLSSKHGHFWSDWVHDKARTLDLTVHTRTVMTFRLWLASNRLGASLRRGGVLFWWLGGVSIEVRVWPMESGGVSVMSSTRRDGEAGHGSRPPMVTLNTRDETIITKDLSDSNGLYEYQTHDCQ